MLIIKMVYYVSYGKEIQEEMLILSQSPFNKSLYHRYSFHYTSNFPQSNGVIALAKSYVMFITSLDRRWAIQNLTQLSTKSVPFCPINGHALAGYA